MRDTEALLEMGEKWVDADTVRGLLRLAKLCRKTDYTGPMTTKIESGAIVIRLPIGTIACAMEGAEERQAELPVRVTNARKFAPYVVQALEREDHDGTTPIHLLFDEAFWNAVEDGAEGVEIGEIDEDADGCVAWP